MKHCLVLEEAIRPFTCLLLLLLLVVLLLILVPPDDDTTKADDDEIAINDIKAITFHFIIGIVDGLD
jgi:hypothetical protein